MIFLGGSSTFLGGSSGFLMSGFLTSGLVGVWGVGVGGFLGIGFWIGGSMGNGSMRISISGDFSRCGGLNLDGGSFCGGLGGSPTLNNNNHFV